MKKLLRMLVALFCLVFLLPGCEKDDPIEPVVGSNPFIEVTISPETVNQGGSSTLVYRISNAKSINLNGESITKMVDTLVYNNLQVGKVFDFEAKNENGTTTLNKKINVVPVQPKLPSLTTLTANPQTLPVGGGITTISWTSNENTTSVEFSGISYPADWSLQVNVVNDSTTLVFEAKGTEGQRSSSILIRVEQAPPPPPLPTKADTLCLFGSWKRAKLEFQINPNAPWIEHSLGIDLLDDIITYYLNPQIGVVDFGELRQEGLPRFNEGPWSLSGDILIQGETQYQILVDQDTLVLVNLITGTTERVRETFIH